MVITEKQEALVKESWEILTQDLPKHSVRMFTMILAVAPEAKNVFSFLRDSDEIPERNPKLKAHAIKVFKLTCESAAQLRAKGIVGMGDMTLKRLGSVHFKNGVVAAQFQVVREAFLKTIEEGVGDKWSEEMSAAWGEAYDQLAAAIQAHMKEDSS